MAVVETPETISKTAFNQPTPPTSQQEAVNSQVADSKSATPITTTLVTGKSFSLATHDVTTLVLTSGEKGKAEVISSKPFQIPAQAKQLRFRLTKYKPTEFPLYQVELLDAGGKVMQVVTGSLTKAKLIEAVFRRNGLTDGEYQLRVTGQGRADTNLTPLTTALVKLSFKAH